MHVNLPKFYSEGDEIKLKYEFAKFSVANEVTDLDSYISVSDYIEEIKGDTYKDICKQIRAGGDKKELKRGLPLFHFLGEHKKTRGNKITVDLAIHNLDPIFKHRVDLYGKDIWSLYSYNGLLVLDIDMVEDIDDFRSKVNQISWVWICHLSSSGKGFRLIAKTANFNVKEYGNFDNYVNDELFKLTGYRTDARVNNINTAFFPSYDPDIYYNESATIFRPNINNAF